MENTRCELQDALMELRELDKDQTQLKVQELSRQEEETQAQNTATQPPLPPLDEFMSNALNALGFPPANTPSNATAQQTNTNESNIWSQKR